MRESSRSDGFQDAAPAVVETARAVVAGYKADTMDEVWVVDDDQSIRWVLERALAKEGFRVRRWREARDGRGGLGEAEQCGVCGEAPAIRCVLERALAKEGFRVACSREAGAVIAALDESVPKVLVS